jgi:molybdenum cofactor cytidylyltransferase
MKLSQALNLQPSDVVAFVGAGGKTSAMFRLADELVQAGRRVITTTTTRLARDEICRAPQQIGIGHAMRLPETLAEQLERYQHVFVFSKLEPDQKVHGFRPAWVDGNLAHVSFAEHVLVEADGSRRLSLKAPLPHEPAIPASSNVVVPVVGLDVLGEPLNDRVVYGADVIHNLTGYPLDAPVTEQLVASIMVNPELGVKNVPAGARVIPLLNQVTPDNLAAARQIAEYILSDLHIDRVMIGAVQTDNPIWEIRRRIGAIILAAGQSKRMGQPKMLLPWGESTMIREVCQQVCANRLQEAVVITGEHHEAILAQLGGLPLRVVQNPNYARAEMLSSLQTGLNAIWNTCDACLVVLGDQPTIDQGVISSLIDAYNQGPGRIVAPSYNKHRGHPLLIDKSFWQAFMDLPRNKAPRDLLKANEDQITYVVVDTASILQDIDTPEDYNRALSSDR